MSTIPEADAWMMLARMINVTRDCAEPKVQIVREKAINLLHRFGKGEILRQESDIQKGQN